jgi:hypothetical protein
MTMTSDTVRMNMKQRDQQTVETALPAYMMALMVEEAQNKGFDLRADVIAHLGRAAAMPLAKVDELSVSRLARQVTDTATTLLTDLNPIDPRHGLYCCAMFVLTLVDEGRFPKVTNQAVLVATLLMDDVKDDRPDVNGALPVWRVEEIKWKAEAKKMLLRANLMGLYLKDNLPRPAAA